MYIDYNLHIVLYGVLFIIGTLFAIKMVTLLIQCLQGWPKVTGFWHDLNEFQRTRDNGSERNDNDWLEQQIEVPLIHRVR